MSEKRARTRSEEPHDGPTPVVAPSDETPRRRHRRVVRPGAERDVLPGASSDEVGTGWSESPEAAGDSNDARLTRDVPPHW